MNVANPAFSGDGASLWAFAWNPRAELQRYDVKTSTFSPHLGGASAVSVSYSRDGKWVVYVDYADRSLWRARADGSDPRQLTQGGDVDGCYFSPDASRIAFRATFKGQQKRVYIIPSDGSGSPQPLTTSDIEQGIPTWSAEGRYLVYGDVPEDFTRQDVEVRLRLFDLQTRATEDVPGSIGLETSRWSPDGRYIAALDRSRQRRITLFDTHSRQWRPLADAVHVDYPSWSTDSAFIYYSTEGLASQQLRRVSVVDGKVELLIDLERANVFTAYWWAGLSADNAPLVSRLDPAQLVKLELRPR
jgi:Tol biopolymer transport system component